MSANKQNRNIHTHMHRNRQNNKKMYKKGERWDELKHRKSEVVKQRER